MARVEEDAELKRLFLSRLQEQYGQSKDGFFVTDFVYCLRKAYWRAEVLEEISGSPRPCLCLCPNPLRCQDHELIHF